MAGCKTGRRAGLPRHLTQKALGCHEGPRLCRPPFVRLLQTGSKVAVCRVLRAILKQLPFRKTGHLKNMANLVIMPPEKANQNKNTGTIKNRNNNLVSFLTNKEYRMLPLKRVEEPRRKGRAAPAQETSGLRVGAAERSRERLHDRPRGQAAPAGQGGDGMVPWAGCFLAPCTQVWRVSCV